MVEIIGEVYTYIVPKEKIEYLWEDNKSCHSSTWYFVHIEDIGDVSLREEMYKQYKKELFGIEEKEMIR